MSAAILAAFVGFFGILIGWFVLGTQRVNEELTKERRGAYAKVLAEADALDPHPPVDTCEFKRAVMAADFLSSKQMYRSGRLRGLLLGEIGSAEWRREELAWFRELARNESQRNSATTRWRHRGHYVDVTRVKLRNECADPSVGCGTSPVERTSP